MLRARLPANTPRSATAADHWLPKALSLCLPLYGRKKRDKHRCIDMANRQPDRKRDSERESKIYRSVVVPSQSFVCLSRARRYSSGINSIIKASVCHLLMFTNNGSRSAPTKKSRPMRNFNNNKNTNVLDDIVSISLYRSFDSHPLNSGLRNLDSISVTPSSFFFAPHSFPRAFNPISHHKHLSRSHSCASAS